MIGNSGFQAQFLSRKGVLFGYGENCCGKVFFPCVAAAEKALLPSNYLFIFFLSYLHHNTSHLFSLIILSAISVAFN